ncbi:MAG: T9SS type B sorting domain-containing protein [Flavobacteriales bacterium]|nr:T9SS type B sorting domain-containing protein [Flavobacteriales bacterium]
MPTPTIQRSVSSVWTIAFVMVCFFSARSQNASSGWVHAMEDQKAFIENRSQFDGLNRTDDQILYAIDHGDTKIFFTEKGITYLFTETEKKSEEELESEHPDWEKLSHAERERLEHEVEATTDVVHMLWVAPSSELKVVSEDKREDYYNYSVGDHSIDGIPAFKRIKYQNVFDGIDVLFEFHPEDGIKYSFIIRPGADPSQIAMRYESVNGQQLDEDGTLHLPTVFGDILEHAPVSFYKDGGQKIPSGFVLDGNIIHFQLDNYDPSRSVVIDPWVQTPTLASSNSVWECDVDQSSNVYIIGGENPLKLLKYNSGGALQWTFSTAYDTVGGDWLGCMATDFNGNSFVSNGSSAALTKVNSAGSQQFNVNGAGLSDEYWTISFNCDQTKLIIGGTTASGLFDLKAGIFDVSPSNGSILNTQAVAIGSTTSFPPTVQEVRSLSPSKNSRYYFLTHDTIGAIDQSFSPCYSGEPIFKEDHGYHLGYKMENYRPNNGNAGIRAIRANDSFVYTHNGTTVHKRSLINGAILGSATIPGGQSSTSLGLNVISNCGIDIDDCGNVYVGSTNGVYKYDANLNLITSSSTSFKVYAVKVNYNGEVVACGSTGTNADVNRTGYVQSLAMSACAPLENICCDPNICPAGPFCQTDAPVTLTAGDPGGVWAGDGITNSSTGVFDPSVAGPGVHTISYTLPCGADSIYISVSACTPLEVCLENNGDLTVLNGTGPYTWDEWVTGISTPITNQAECEACGYTWVPFVNTCSGGTTCASSAGWSNFATGTTVTPTNYPVRVVDAVGDSLVINDPNTLTPCTQCALPTVTYTTQDPACEGGADGSIDLTVTGASTYDFAWDNSATTEDISNLTAGGYQVTITDQTDQTCDTTFTVTLNDGTSPTISGISITDASCGNADGQIDVTAATATQFSSDGGTNFQASGSFPALAAGSYDIVVEDANGCQADSTVSVNNANGPSIDNLASTDPNCGASDGTIDITASGGATPLQYSIDNGVTFQSSGSFTGLNAGSFDIVVEDANGCQAVDQIDLNSSGGPTIDNVSTTDATCGVSNGQIDITASGGTPPLSYSIDNGTTTQTTSSFTGLAAGTYDVVVDDGQGCPATQQVTLNSSGGATIDNVAVTDATCGQADGQIDITASGGTAPLQYSTDNGLTFQNGSQFTGLLAGNYDLVVEDASGCQTTQSASVANGGAPTISSITPTDALCKGDCNGSIDVVAVGATQYSIDNGTTFQATGTFTGICAGTYDVVVDDGAGCQAFGQAVVGEPAAVTASSTSTDATCSGACDGTITVNAGGGVSPYQYSIDNGSSFQGSGNFASVCDGSYSIVVEDANGCQQTANETVNVPNPITFNFSTVDVTCFNDCDGSASVTVAGGTSPYSYSWSSLTGTGSTQSAVCAGTYTLTITDDSGCSVDTTFQITQPALVAIENVLVTAEGCEGDCDGSIIIQSSAANAFSIDGGDTFEPTADFLDLCSGDYAIMVLDTISGCGNSDSVAVAPGAHVVSDFVPRPDVVSEFDSEILFDNNSIGATMYEWHFGDENFSYDENPSYDFQNEPGTYLVCLVADNGLGCIDTSCKYVDVTPIFTIYVPNAFTPDVTTGKNDVFLPIIGGDYPDTYHLQIFDRWGERVFETNNIDTGWDGTYKDKQVQKGVYVWMIEVEKVEGGFNRKFVGHVSVVR